ncbi:acetyltransferase [Pedobacter caeni]|uniref:Sugar O-acyltransferase, sialic acid O-acetyltransferase NeuD family n=1 Tax=Pedobacter caeni TaxID=288992 RepID=A0A1M5PQN2_9SPHI|nr:acetyltransferase [Pedobacter caeni]SHH03859.1 sugar O-acyltransferase, sialic acid O-acetyltransferase NeuD family [Pedobacter caeni]
MEKEIVLMGYSGHAYVIADILSECGTPAKFYCDGNEKQDNPFDLIFLGPERAALESLRNKACFVAIGENKIRRKIIEFLISENIEIVNAIHPLAYLSKKSVIGKGVMLSVGAKINACAELGTGVICNTGSVVEHECKIGDYVHIAPGVVICGNVYIGENSFIGANTVIKQGVKIGSNVTIGAGSVVLNDVEDSLTVVGNPIRVI